MKTKLLASVAAAGMMLLAACSDDEQEMKVGGAPLKFDSNPIYMSAQSDSILVKATITQPGGTYEGWGIGVTYTKKNGEIVSTVSNQFDTVVVNDNENYQVPKPQVVGDWYTVEKREDHVFVLLKDNNDAERSLVVQFIGPAGTGELEVIQAGAE